MGIASQPPGTAKWAQVQSRADLTQTGLVADKLLEAER